MSLIRPSSIIVQMVPVHCIARSHRLKIDFLDENFKNLLVWNHIAYSIDIWYVASTSRPLPNLFKLFPWGQKWARPGSHMFYIGLYWEKHEKIFLSETIRPRALIFSMLHHLVNLYQFCSNYALGAKNGLPLGSHCLHSHREKTLKNILSETIRPNALIFGMWISTKFIQIMPLGTKMAPPRGHMFYIGRNMKKSSCLKPQGPEPWYLAWSIT